MSTEAHIKRLLVISQNEETSQTVQHLASANYAIISVATPSDGLQMLTTLPIQVVLVDDMMDPGDTTAFLARLHEEFPTVVPIGLTGSSEHDSDARSISNKGFYHCLAVPLNPVEFNTVIQQAFDHYYSLNAVSQTETTAEYNRFMMLQRKLSALEQSNRRLRRQNEHMGAMLRAAAHDLRNPLGAILAVSELLVSEETLDIDERKEYQGVIHREAETMLRLLNALLDLQKLSTDTTALQRRDVNVRQFMEEVIDSGQHLARRKDITLRSLLPDDLPVAHFDPTHIRRVLDNLIDNAVKFSPPSSTIVLEVADSPEGTVFAVVDQGPGISENERNRIFLPFTRGSAQPTGNERSTGLGLTICRTIVEQHGGHIDVTAVPGGGSRFHFTLPR